MKKTYLVGVIILLIIILFGIILIVGQKQENGDSENEYIIYQNTKYGFSLEYPRAWHSFGAEPDSSIIRFSDTFEDSGDGGVPMGAVIDIYILENYENLSLEDWIEQSLEYGPEREILREDIFSGNYANFIQKTFAPFPGPIEAGSVITAYTSLAGDDYIVQINYLGREPNYTASLKYFERLLKTANFYQN